jgi:hypothetical protein
MIRIRMGRGLAERLGRNDDDRRDMKKEVGGTGSLWLVKKVEVTFRTGTRRDGMRLRE